MSAKQSVIKALKNLRDDVKELPWVKIADDGSTLLVEKPEVLFLIETAIEAYEEGSVKP